MTISEEDISGIPDMNNFAIDGATIKEVLSILQTVDSRDRNKLFLLWRIDSRALYYKLKALPEVQVQRVEVNRA